ncbi:hypothetical protein BDQ17DRAFT_629986 [Cyathus striatus]|nr:hypothetical protein BDQ17DRAFT_629986 [Cyathus striatus]
MPDNLVALVVRNNLKHAMGGPRHCYTRLSILFSHCLSLVDSPLTTHMDIHAPKRVLEMVHSSQRLGGVERDVLEIDTSLNEEEES